MTEAYKVLKKFTGNLKGKEHVFESGEIISMDEVNSWKNSENLLSCRFIIKTIIDEKDDIKNKEVFQ